MTTPSEEAKIFYDRRVIILLVTLVNIVPVTVTSLANHTEFSELLAFVLVGIMLAAIYYFWLSRVDAQWAKVIIVSVAWLYTSVYIELFSDVIADSYLTLIVFVQLVFLLYGARYGVFALCLAVVGDAYHIVVDGDNALWANIFLLSVQGAVGMFAWIFVSAARTMGGRAERLADEVSRLNRIIIGSQDRERRRLAKDLHDGPLQSMGVELLAIDRIKRRLDQLDYEEAGRELDYLRGIARETANDLRTTINALRNTLLDGGVEPAIRNLARKTQDATSMPVTVTLERGHGHERGESLQIPEAMASCIYQLCAEALNNAKSHSGASSMTITLKDSAEEIELVIEDNGTGFDYQTALEQSADSGHTGLYIMRERAAEFGGKMSVTSVQGKGTTVAFTFPHPR